MTNLPTQRVSSIPAPESYTLPGRPDDASRHDAYRQTQFVLGGDLELFAREMNLQLALFRDCQPSKYRTHELAAIAALWSRTYLMLQDALLLVSRGSYVSAVPVIKAATELVAAQEGLRRGEMNEHHEWLAGALRPNETFKAFDFELGSYFAGGVLASDNVLGAVYRASADLARPNFGASLLQVAPESNNQRLAIAFADSAFHLGWAELHLGWLLALTARQVRVIVDADTIFPVSDERRAEYADLQAAVDSALTSTDRCRIEEVREGSDRRYLVHDFRRNSSGSPKKVLL
ncbi:MAG: hypothetical protein AB7T32_10985 [Dehalococcoidia bacterium]